MSTSSSIREAKNSLKCSHDFVNFRFFWRGEGGRERNGSVWIIIIFFIRFTIVSRMRESGRCSFKPGDISLKVFERKSWHQVSRVVSQPWSHVQ